MLFNSFDFGVFFIVVFSGYLLCRHSLRVQNRLLLIASYFFYACWDWRFLSLIILSTVIDFFAGIKIAEAGNKRRARWVLFLSVGSNLSILGFFKYCDFFLENFQHLLVFFGYSFEPRLLNIILPVGISFYTFQSMSYTIDIYRGRIRPTRRFLDFALFVAFFPQLVAGPIERARTLLPQVLAPRILSLEKIYAGCHLIFWGFFKKVVIADNLTTLVDPVFAADSGQPGWVIIMAVYAFVFQIYCDFSGYSDIARGVGKCLGFDIMVNFRLPYFAANPADVWRRWHISLSSWLRDYLYISLGGNRLGTLKRYRNLLITFTLGGLWHGAAWNYVLWGVFWGISLTLYHLALGFWPRPKERAGPAVRRLTKGIKIFLTFQLWSFALFIFRCRSVEQIGRFTWSMLRDFFSEPVPAEAVYFGFKIAFFVLPLFAVQLAQYLRDDLDLMRKLPLPLRTLFYVVVWYYIVIFGVTDAREFIYFQF
jgi:D-alanyl-lipoteichoic acid acyltransferase DltB (MBOAT superfamily)